MSYIQFRKDKPIGIQNPPSTESIIFHYAMLNFQIRKFAIHSPECESTNSNLFRHDIRYVEILSASLSLTT